MGNLAASVRAMEPAPAAETVDRDADARRWIAALRASGVVRDDAAARLHALLLRAARFELGRRPESLEGAARETIDDLAMQSADDALSAILSKLDEYRFESRFTTWAYKFAILDAAMRARRRAWQHRELPTEPDDWSGPPARALVTSSARSYSPMFRSTSSRSGSARPAGPCTRPSTTPGGSCGPRSELKMTSSPDSRRVSKRLLAALLGPPGPEVTCEQCFAVLDAYVEHELAGEDADARVPGMRARLEGCPACAEEHDSLRDLTVSETGERI